ncbi:hypothetical protein D9757_006675 [Collybiopsis confluens]|uniref:Zn(2)-C6 fungal-type domain-containing protein n=1 Tax=Collybiopsis confluens TaxID=2823264 RepID=A0A8H5HN23_9AGAR|nr:hypothetical protein D9757_006675 [Collybiopsis confluens]
MTLPNQSLAPGSACLRCRQRKIKCSGSKPVCAQCKWAEVADDCEYVGRSQRSTISKLQADVDRLQTRIRELERKSPATGRSRPSGRPHLRQRHQDPLEPPAQIRKHLTDLFFESTNELSFSLNITRCRDSVLLPIHPDNHHTRPSTALRSMIYVWGAHLSQDSSLKQLTESHLAFALRELASPDYSRLHPYKLVHTIQAEVLLARYFISTGKVVEGGYHISRAKAMAIWGGFMKIRSNQPPVGQSSSTDSRSTLLPPSADAIEEGDRIMIFWTVFTLDKLWAVVLDMAGTDTVWDKASGYYLDTPWPQEPEVYEQGGNFLPEGYSFTTANFLHGIPTLDRGNSTQAMLAKAAYCWEYAADLAREFPKINSSEQYTEFMNLYNQRRRWIENFLSTMTVPNDVPNRTPDKMARLLQAHSIAYAAYIQILRVPTHGYADAATRTQSIISSAQKIVKLIGSPFLTNYAWQLVYVILVESCRTHWNPETIEDLRCGLTFMANFSNTCGFMKYCFEQMHIVFATIDGSTGDDEGRC